MSLNNNMSSQENPHSPFPYSIGFHEDIRNSEKARKNIFPTIDIDLYPSLPASPFDMVEFATSTIALYAQYMGLCQLKINHARYFVQPLGFVSGGVDLDLITGVLIQYSMATVSNSQTSVETADMGICERLKRILNSEAFLKMPSKIATDGCDGTSYLIEANLAGIYSWKCHWSPKDAVFREVQRIFDELITEREING
jgi:hypothetical protein